MDESSHFNSLQFALRLRTTASRLIVHNCIAVCVVGGVSGIQ